PAARRRAGRDDLRKDATAEDNVSARHHSLRGAGIRTSPCCSANQNAPYRKKARLNSADQPRAATRRSQRVVFSAIQGRKGTIGPELPGAAIRPGDVFQGPHSTSNAAERNGTWPPIW